MGVAKKLIDKKLLRDLVPINALSTVHLEEISRKAIIADVRSGRFVFRHGDRDYQSVYLLEGKIELLSDKGDVVAQVQAGSEAARHPLAHKQPRQLSARAAGNVTIACVDSSLLDVLLTWDESAGYDVVEIDAQDDDDWMTRMLQSHAFLQLPPSNIHQLLMRLEMVSARAGDVVVRQDDDGDYFYIVKSGRLSVTRKASPRSKEVALAELGEGACFGEEALVSDAKRNASVTMITDGDLMRLSKQDFRELLCTPLVHEIGVAEARELVAKGARWLDVRLPGEFGNQAIKGSLNMPLSALRDASAQLDSSATYILCCDTGRRSAAGAFVLSQRGFNVYVLRKGLMDVPEDMLTAPQGAAPADAAQPERDAEIIPFESENRDGAARGGSANPVPAAPRSAAEPSGPEAKKLQAQLRATQEQLAESEAQRSEERAISERVMQQLESLERELQQLREEREVLEARLQGEAGTQSRHDELQDLVATLEKKLQEKDKHSQQLDQDLVRVREDYRQLGQRASALGGERDAAVRDLEKVRNDLQNVKQQLNSRHGEVSEQIRALEDMLEARARELEEAESRRRDLEQQLEALDATRQALQQEYATLAERADAQGAEKDALAADLEGLRQQLDGANAELEAAAEREQALQGTLGEVEASRQSLDQLRAEALAEREALDRDLAGLRDQLVEKQRQLEDSDSRHDGLEAQLAEAGQALEAQRAQAEAQFDEAQRVADASIDQLRTEADAARQSLGHEIEELRSQLAGQAQALEEAQSRHNEDERRAADLEQERDALAAREQALQDELRTREQQAEASRAATEQEAQRAREIEEQLAGAQQRYSEAEAQIAGLEARLKETRKEYESDIGSVRGALARAQDEQENVKRDQKRLMDALRKAENALAQAKQDHEAEVYRLRKELKESAGEASSGLAAEMEALQQQLKEQAEQREALELSLGSRSEQLESSRHQVERLNQQLEQARDSARQAEQQLVEANQTADQEMAVRLQAEQEAQQALREALEKVTLERDGHQEQLTVLVQEAAELREALAAQAATHHAAAEDQRQLGALREQLELVGQERDRLKASEKRLQKETDQLRAEAEVTRGLVDMSPCGDGDIAVHEELAAVKKNVEVAVRLRSQAEAKASELQEEVARLEDELARVRLDETGSAGVARIPSLDANDPQASGILTPDIGAGDEAYEEPPRAAGVLLEADSVPENAVREKDLAQGSPKRSGGGWKSMAAGLLIGALAASAAMWWMGRTPVAVVAPAAEPGAAPMPAPEPEPTPTPSTRPATPSAKSEFKSVPPVAWGLSDRQESAADTVPGAGAVPQAEANGGEGISEAEVDEVAEAVPVVSQPAGYFRDRLSTGEPGPAMVELSADRFFMGSGPASPHFDERPRHEVQLRRFAISRYETTVDEYERFAWDTGRAQPQGAGRSSGTLPVVNVSWQDAVAYAEWLSRQTGQRYRLPTEAEWEFAARSGSGTRFWWGNEVGEARASCFDCGGGAGGRSALAVGTFEPSGFGVYDMAGNAREWVQDCYTPGYAAAAGDGSAAESAGCAERVVRGGGFGSPSDKLRSTARDASAPKTRLNDLGFRVVRDY